MTGQSLENALKLVYSHTCRGGIRPPTTAREQGTRGSHVETHVPRNRPGFRKLTCMKENTFGRNMKSTMHTALMTLVLPALLPLQRAVAEPARQDSSSIDLTRAFRYTHDDSPKAKMEYIFFPVAPFLTKDTKIHPLDILRWIEGKSPGLDMDGAGVRFSVEVHDDRPPTAPDTMAKWYPVEWRDMPIPQVVGVKLGDYLSYLGVLFGWTFEPTKDKIVVRAKTSPDQRKSEQSAPADLPGSSAEQ